MIINIFLLFFQEEKSKFTFLYQKSWCFYLLYDNRLMLFEWKNEYEEDTKSERSWELDILN